MRTARLWTVHILVLPLDVNTCEAGEVWTGLQWWPPDVRAGHGHKKPRTSQFFNYTKFCLQRVRLLRVRLLRTVNNVFQGFYQ